MKINVKKLHPDAILPTYGTGGAACFDIYTTMYGVVNPKVPVSFHTGLAFEVPKDHVMLVFSRSGDGFNRGVRLANCTGIIDSDYRGELLVKLHSDMDIRVVTKGERVAQALILPVEQVYFEAVKELSDTERGDGGFGSTGVL